MTLAAQSDMVSAAATGEQTPLDRVLECHMKDAIDVGNTLGAEPASGFGAEPAFCQPVVLRFEQIDRA